VLDDLHELAQSIIQKALVQATLGGGSIGKIRPVLILFGLWTAYQVGEVQVFKDDDLVLLYELLGLLVMEVSSLIGYLAVCFRHRLACLFPPMAASFLPC
jgi:hypothetical protein